MKPLDRTLLKTHQVEELLEEKAQIQDTLSPSNPFRKNINKPQLMHQRARSIDKILEEYAPEKLPGHEQDQLMKREKELREFWTQGMPSEEEMRKNPPGNVNKHMKWHKHTKNAVSEWKNVRRQLEPDSDDPDLANIERFRPSGVMDRLVADAQIRGAMNYRAIPQENWDTAFEGKGPENTALKQAERVAEEQGKGKRQYTDEQKEAMRQRLAAARAKRHSPAKDPSLDTSNDGVPAMSEA